MLGDKLNKKLGEVRLPFQNQGGPPGGGAAQSAPVSEPFYHIYAYCNNGQDPLNNTGAAATRFTLGNQYVDPPGSAMWVFGTTGMGTTKWEIATMGN